MRSIQALFILLITTALPTAANDSWPHWGGPDGNFRLERADIADSWPEDGPMELWLRDLGPGYTGIVGAGKTLYTAYYDDGHEVVVALSAEDGKTIWERKYPTKTVESQVLQFGKGPNAPLLLHKGRLYVLSFDSQLHCLNARSGEVVWRKHLGEEMGAEVLRFGAAAAPVVYKDMVMVQLGGKEHGVVGFSLKDGAVKWKSEPIPVNYAAPAIFKRGGMTQMVFMAKKEAVSVSMADGKVIWRVPHTNQYDVHAAQPLYDGGDHLLIVSQRGSGSKTLKLSADGKSVEQVAESNLFNIFHSNAVLIGKTAYGANDKVLMAMDITTGKLLWRERGYDRANLIQVGDKWILLTESGKLSLARLSPEKFELLASQQYLAKPAWTVPTILGNKLFMRDKRIMIALDLGR
ncbi:MAG: PQQ-binding-like beta-propeller repeat protein [Acidobacteriota bacterium]|nr:PQQ-binding-like beta-propeller repeat protein [Acidobacteriota bacterium]